MMRKLITLIFTLAVCVTALSASAYGQDTSGNTKSTQKAPMMSREAKVTGELVNLDCYVGQELRGAKLTTCSQESMADQPRLALLSGGKLYVLVSDDKSLRLGEKLSEFVGKRMWLIGTRKTLDGGGSALVVRGLRGELAR